MAKAIKVALPTNSGFTFKDIFGIFDYLAVDAVPGTITSTQISGTGIFDNSAADFRMTGTGFTLGMIDGRTYVTSGFLDDISFTTIAAGTLTVSKINIKMSGFSKLVALDQSGANPNAVENFLMTKKAWNITLGDLDDIAPKGTLVGDGVPLDLTGNDTIRGMGGDDVLFGGKGDDKLFGGTGDDTLDGGKDNDFLEGGDGNDTVIGGSGSDRLYGGAGRDRLVGGGADDELYGGADRDKILGGSGFDNLFGGAGRDKLKGGEGMDRLDGGTGNDVLTGGGASDTFIFIDGDGNNTIRDFDALDNNERIAIQQVSAIKNFTDLRQNYMVQAGDDVVIDDGAGLLITLLGVTLGDLGKNDFFI